MSSSEQQQLNSVYLSRLASHTFVQDFCDTRKPPEGFVDTCYGPFLVAVSENYLASRPRVVIVGQETAGWIGFYKDVLSADTLRISLDEYTDFNFAEKKCGNLTFWQTFNRIRSELLGESADRRAIMWLNLFKLQDRHMIDSKAGDSIYLNCVLELQGSVVRDELRILSPDVVLFLTGKRYDHVIERLYGPECIRAFDDRYPTDELARIVHPELPALSYRTWHPRTLLQGRYQHCLPAIINEVKQGWPRDVKSGPQSKA